MDLQDRRYLAQCVQHLSSTSLAKFLDLLLDKHPSQVVERKGGESYHIDFGTLSPAAFSDAKEFIKTALKDDDDYCCFNENDQKQVSKIANGNYNLGAPQIPYNSGSIVKPIIGADSPQQQQPLQTKNSFPANSEISPQGVPLQVPTQNQAANTQSTPALPYPKPITNAQNSKATTSNGSAGSSVQQTNTFSPEKSSAKLKRIQLSPSNDTRQERPTRASTKRNLEQSPLSKRQKESEAIAAMRKDESRYYNGERVWRQKTEDLHFNFHGIDVILLSLEVDTKRPWQCGTCGKAFVSKDKIVNHVQQHSGEKLHECPVCKGKFSSKHYLKEHQKRVHLFHCHHCDAVFDTFDELHEHSGHEHPDQASLKTCSCKKGCNNSRCSCFKNGLNCNDSCQCWSCNNKA
jgi:hypothetical protein